MQHRLTPLLFPALLFFGFVLFSETASAAQARALTYGWSYVDTACRIEDLDATYFGDLWLDVMDNHYGERTLDETIFASEVTDRTKAAWGDDEINANLDDGDATLLVSHGGSNGNEYWRGQLTTDSGNGGSDTCKSRSTHMRIGNDDAEFLHMTNCRSALWGIVFVAGGYPLMDVRLHQFGGFHGTSNTANWNKVDDFAEDAWEVNDSVALAWIDNMTDIDYWGDGENGLCAVSISGGNSSEHAHSRANYEDYGSGFDDPEYNYNWYKWICGCDPKGDHPPPHALPDC